MMLLWFMAVVNLLLALLCIYSLDRAAKQTRRMAEILSIWEKLIEGHTEDLGAGIRTLTAVAARLRVQEEVRLRGLAALERHVYDLTEGKKRRKEELARQLRGIYVYFPSLLESERISEQARGSVAKLRPVAEDWDPPSSLP